MEMEKGGECMESVGNNQIVLNMVGKLQSQSEDSEMGETESEVVSNNSGRHGSKKNMSRRDGHVCRFCSRVFSSGRALGGHIRVHGTSRSNGQASSSMHVSRGDYSSTDMWVKESKPPTGGSYGNSKWGRAKEEEEEEEQVKDENMDVGKEEEEEQVKDKTMDVWNEKELGDQKMVVPLYTLRKNPKRSKRLRDLEFGVDLSTKNSTSCNECGKEFRSSKELLGHVGCHPERRIHDRIYASDDDDSHGNTKSGALSHGVSQSCWQSSERSEDVDTEEEEDAAGSDNEGDRMGMKEPVSRSFLTWSVTSKRGRRVPIRSRALLKDNDYAEEETMVNNIKELEDDTDTAHFLMMLASSASNTNKGNRPPDEMTKKSVHHAKAGKGESQGSSEDSETGHEEKRADKYECCTCKEVFDSHQALGGHRASHRNIKCCTAITNGAEKEMAEEDKGVTEVASSVLMVDMDSSEEEKNANGSHLTRQKNLKKAIMVKSKGHECSVCSKVFSSGQALGGHKRCHWIVDRLETSTSVISNKKRPKQGHLRTAPNSKPVFDLNQPAPVEEEDLEAASHGIIEVVHASDDSVNDKVKMVDDIVSNAGFRYV